MGAPAHGAIRWPARSPDLNPLDFFIQGVFEVEAFLVTRGTTHYS
jgi:hypothetical protein